MTDETTVLYNARCPICSAEIDYYARYVKARALPITFEDLNQTELSRWGVSTDQAARQLHVLQDGKLVSGVDAFILLWAQMPRYRRLARIVGTPWLRPVAALVYNRILAPLLYALHRRRKTA